MPRRFAGDGTEVCGAKELHQIDLRNMVDIVFPERLDVPLLAPVVDGGLAVTDELCRPRRRLECIHFSF